MSKRKQTENLHLYAYELTNGLPTFLKDWSDNMAILDSAHSAVLSLIDALDGRLTTAEGTLEDLSPESIQDYKIRLDALEKKVVINTNGIKDVNTKIATVNAQINTINAEQIVQNNRLTALETLDASHTELINALRTDLTGVDGRVTTLEQCCENVQHEITDIQHDIDGFNDDVTALGTQVETLSNAVTELTELVNNLQLDVVSQRLDSFEASLTALTNRVTTAESNIVAQGATLEEHNTRITANTNNIEDIDTEIGDTDYSEIGNSVSASLVELADRIRALTPQEYDVLISRLNTVETEVGDIESTVDNLDSSVSALQTSVASKANASDVTALSTLVSGSLDVTDPTEGDGVIKFGVDANGNYGYKKVGADTVTPFKGNEKEIYWVTVERKGSTINHRISGYVISHKDLDIALLYHSSNTADIYVNYELIQQVSTSSIDTEFENVVRLYMPNFPFYSIFQYASDSTYGTGYIIKWQSIKNQTLNAINTHNSYVSNHNFGIKQQSVNIAKDDYVTISLSPTLNSPAFNTTQTLPNTGIYIKDMSFIKIIVES